MELDSRIYLLRYLKIYLKLLLNNINKQNKKEKININKLKINVDKKWKKLLNNNQLNLI